LPVLVAPRVIERTPPVITHACRYGCCHGSLLDLVQMASRNTKHALKTGNFFYGKTCADCTMPIAELFATSKNKALFYYCTVDFNVAELDNDATVSCAPKPCDCILCITCYFARDTRKQASNGQQCDRADEDRQQQRAITRSLITYSYSLHVLSKLDYSAL
jgi:hypothetical protein